MEKITSIKTHYIAPLCYDIFLASLLVYTASNLLETVRRGMVVDYINIQYLLIVCIISGALAVLLSPPDTITET